MTLSALDPRVKLFFMLAVSSVSIFSKSVARLALLLLITVLILVLGRADLRSAAKRVSGVLKLIITIFVLQCIFTRSGEALITLFGVTIITQEGLMNALVVAIRLVIIVTSAVIVLSGETRDYLLALQQLHMPYELAFMVLAALRFIPLLRETASDVISAVQMRGTRLKGVPLKSKASVYISALIPIVAGAIRRSEQLSTAMEARGFRANTSRTNMRVLTMRFRDYACIAGCAALLTALCVLI